jgi:hypothetical protein
MVRLPLGAKNDVLLEFRDKTLAPRAQGLCRCMVPGFNLNAKKPAHPLASSRESTTSLIGNVPSPQYIQLHSLVSFICTATLRLIFLITYDIFSNQANLYQPERHLGLISFFLQFVRPD